MSGVISVGGEAVHVNAPRPVSTHASESQNCPAQARDGRRCGGRRMLLKFFEWYGVDATCYHCGAHFGDDGVQAPGRANVERVRREWREVRTT